MAGSHWEVLDADRELFARELDSFVPSRIFDAHCHLYRKRFFGGDAPPLVRAGPDVDFATSQRLIAEITPGRRTSGLFFGFPHAALDVETTNEFVADQALLDSSSRSQMLVTPGMDPEYVRETVRKLRFSGLKCYHVWSTSKPTLHAPIPDYLPEEHVRSIRNTSGRIPQPPSVWRAVTIRDAD